MTDKAPPIRCVQIGTTIAQGLLTDWPYKGSCSVRDGATTYTGRLIPVKRSE